MAGMTDEEYHEQLRKFIQDERDRRARTAPPSTYEGKNMNIEKMPLGCWIWVILVVMVAGYVVQKIIH